MASIDQIREAAEADLITFIRLVSPVTVLGHVHEDLCNWWTRSEAKSHQLTLLPRDHQKSRMVAFRVAWHLTKHPDHRVLYISSTANLAEKQLRFIKDILTSSIYRRYWPDHVNREEGKRAKWTNSEIELDHPLRAHEGVRDPSIFTAGLTTGITGMHCDVAVLDDVVVQENAYTSEGRSKVRSQYSLLSSIEGTDALEWVVGTRYEGRDLYNDLVEMEEELFNDEGEIIGFNPIYEKFERQVESQADGTGEFLWPRQQRHDGKWFGFDRSTLAKKRAQYLDKVQFYAQYYNDPNRQGAGGYDRSNFQYYEPQHLTQQNGYWYYKGKRLNVGAAIDFAYSLTGRADYTAIVVVGVDSDGFWYILDIDRFKTEMISEYFQHVLSMHTKWGFRKIRAEVTSAQKAIVKELKNSYIRPQGVALVIDEHSPTKNDGDKAERINAVLKHLYENNSVYHYRGGYCQTLEEELTSAKPSHDDVADATANAISITVKPTSNTGGVRRHQNIVYHPRFGGIRA